MRDCGQYFTSLTTNATSGNFIAPLSPNAMSTRLADLAEAYNLYRFVGFALELYPPLTSTAGPMALAVIVDTVDSVTTSTTFTQNTTSQLPFVAVTTAGLTVPQRFEIPRSALMGKSAALWFKTNNASTVEAWDENHLTLVASAASLVAETIYYKVYYMIEFCDPVPPALVPRPLVDFSEINLAKSQAKAASCVPVGVPVRSLVTPVHCGVTRMR